MPNLITLPLALDARKATCRAVIETPKGSRHKVTYDPESGIFKLTGLLPEGMMFPFDFGFVPSTLGEDGDPLDILIVMDVPGYVGCLVDVRILGVISADQTEDGKKAKNDRLLGVSLHSYEYQNLTTIREVSPVLLSQVEAFFISYNRQRGKTFKVTGTGGPRKALAALSAGMRAHQKAQAKEA